ncbi:MAG TPA: four helix bundle protein [Sedimentisphaerales bacterium]|nr:four helix bundle protein [Sedimentisphaerales bacterium]
MMKENDRLTNARGQIENAQRRDVKYKSRKDFVHKMKICLKELRETSGWLKIIRRRDLLKRKGELEALIGECNELISIFVKSIKTARNNMGTTKE